MRSEVEISTYDIDPRWLLKCTQYPMLQQCNRPYSHKLITINNYVNCPSNFAFARSFHPPIFEKILMRIRSIANTSITASAGNLLNFNQQRGH